MKQLGTLAPDVRLPDVVTGRTMSDDELKGPKGMLVMFICRHCPFVKHVQDELARIGRDYEGQGVGMVAISANDVTSHPEDSPTKLVYRGQLDDSRPGNDIAVTGKDLRAALDAVIAGTPVPADQRASIGCNIKWR